MNSISHIIGAFPLHILIDRYNNNLFYYIICNKRKIIYLIFSQLRILTIILIICDLCIRYLLFVFCYILHITVINYINTAISNDLFILYACIT